MVVFVLVTPLALLGLMLLMDRVETWVDGAPASRQVLLPAVPQSQDERREEARPQLPAIPTPRRGERVVESR